MHDVVVSAVSAAVAAAMSMRRIASQTEFFFIVISGPTPLPLPGHFVMEGSKMYLSSEGWVIV